MTNQNYALARWRPPEETVEAVGAVLGSRWSAARVSSSLFWPQSSWLRQLTRRPAEGVPASIAAHLSALRAVLEAAN